MIKNIRSIKKLILNQRISAKITVFYLLLLIFTMFSSSFLYEKIYSNIISKKVSDISIQTLYSINSNINTLVNNLDYYSRIILSNEDIQRTLKNNLSYTDVATSIRVNKMLTNFGQAIPVISSIYVFDNNGNKFFADKIALKLLFKFDRISEANWYDEVQKKKGGYIIAVNGAGSFEKNSQGNLISLIRIINDIDSQKPIGAIIINISDDVLKNTFKEIVTKYNTDIAIFDKNDQPILDFGNKAILSPNELQNIIHDKTNTSILNKGGKDYLLSSKHIDVLNWRIMSIMHFNELSKESDIFNVITFAIIFLNGIILFAGSLFISSLITTPIKKLLKSMKGVKNGEFKVVNTITWDDEIGMLKDGYNLMIEEIQNLFNKVLEEQKVKRKAELNALQAQIKPHFLYNSFDAISNLALSGQNEEVYDSLVALGNYYRTSLSKGNDIISVREEIEIVRNYLIIQKLRYEDLFTVKYYIDERVHNFKIPKLVLQPMVENAIYHGIKPKGYPGEIVISAEYNTEYIELKVEDDGVGMSREEVERITGSDLYENKTSFGIRGTMERLKIFYGTEEVFTIVSKKGTGTIFIIKIPME